MAVNLALLAVVLAAFADNGTVINPGDVCQSASCVTLAAALTQNMNASVDPCDDFFAYACGGWMDRNPIPDDQTRYSSFTQLRDHNQLTLRRILDGAVRDAAAGSKTGPAAAAAAVTTATAKAVAFYSSCMDRAAAEAAGTTPLDDVMSRAQFVPSSH